jgi:hypothetical protein
MCGRSMSVLFAAAGLVLGPDLAAAQWVPNGTLLATGCLERTLGAVSDGMSGVMVLAPEVFPSGELLTRRTADGFSPPGWPSTALAPSLLAHGLASDGAGGAFVGSIHWGPGNDLVVHHVDADGVSAPDWPAGGRVVSGPDAYQCQLASDQVGGVYVVWGVQENGESRLRVLRLALNGDASPGWPAAGILLDATTGTTEWITLRKVHADGTGLFVQGDHGSQLLVTESSYLARVTPEGTIPNGWESGPRPFPFTTSMWENGWIPDATGGLFSSWRAPSLGRLVHLQEDGALDPAWPDSGLAILPGHPWFQSVGGPVADGVGGCFAWFVHDSTGSWDMRSSVVHVTADGETAPGWPASGARLPMVEDGRQFLNLVPDAAGGVYAVWLDDFIDPEHHAIRVQHYGPSGAVSPGWPESGLTIAGGPGGRGVAQGIRSLNHGLIVVWEDSRRGDPNGFVDVYGIGLTADGNITTDVTFDGGALGTAMRTGPNPSAGAVRLWLNMPRKDVAKVEIVDVSGRLVRNVFEGSLSAGEHVIDWDGRGDSGIRLAPGIYFARTFAGGAAHSSRIVRLAPLD